ncbi:vesicle-associated protein 1-4-like [Cucurbita pepo subsp. pepo]|uniref:vesicle-associated protein 1-4-like n=1 Tax=Cucurbita pepo subsp. pepo TaxID=3664 RepID=UPI000C9D6EEB|nr:vesicle-associated protein 1-4-like [Cucurbita pepo subsp. pepo]
MSLRYVQAMQRSFSAVVRSRILSHQSDFRSISRGCDVFINHRGIDTKKNVAGLLFDHLTRIGLRPFLDSKNMRPGDKLFDEIKEGIRSSKIGIAVFSPRYCESYYCLHELAMMVENKKKIIPIFVDVRPSELHVKYSHSCPENELQRFNWALGEAKYTVGLTFDSINGDWSKLLRKASNAVIDNLIASEGVPMSDNQAA